MGSIENNLHPAFEGGEVTLVAADGMRFTVPLDKLVAHSTFFKSRSEQLNETGNASLALADIHSASLAWALSAIDAQESAKAAPTFPGLEIAAGVFKFALECDLPCLYKPLLAAFWALPVEGADYKTDPFVVYTFSAIARDAERVGELAKPIRGKIEKDVTPWAAETLQVYDPAALTQLVRFMNRWIDDTTRFTPYFVNLAFQIRHDLKRQEDEEPNRCPDNCAMRQDMDGEFKLFCERFCNAFLKAAGTDLPNWRTQDCINFAHNLYPKCDTCALDLGDLLGYVWKHFDRTTWWELTLAPARQST